MNNIMDYGTKISGYLGRLKGTIDSVSVADINTFINVLESSKESGATIFIMGNGGSAATASHFVCDFNKGVSLGSDTKYKFVCLNDNVPSLMAYANDLSYDDIFIEQLKNFFKEGDLVIGISGSGNSKNVIQAIEYANANGGVTLGLTGYDGGVLKKITKYGVHIPIDDMQITEDLHMILDHCIMKILSE